MYLELLQGIVNASILSLEAIATLAVSIALPVFLVTMFSFIPAVIELKRPRDAGPRLISGGDITYMLNLFIIDSEREPLVVQPAPKFSNIFPLLVNLET